MVSAKEDIEAGDATRRKVFIVVGLLTALIVAGMIGLIIYRAQHPGRPNNSNPELRLPNALRAGAPEFNDLRSKIVVDFVPDEDAFESTRPLGDIVMELHPKVRNFTGRTLTGLELQATVIDLDGKTVQTHTYIFPHPPQTTFELEPNKVLTPSLVMEGFRKEDVRANIKIDVTGFTVR